MMAAALLMPADAEIQAESTPDAWLHKFVLLAEQPDGSAPALTETERLFSLEPSGDAACPSLLELTDDHPKFVAHAWASMIGSETCSDLRLSLVSVGLAIGPRCATHVVDYFTKAFARDPQVEHPEPNTDYRWQIAPGRAVVVTKYGGHDDDCSIAFAQAARPPRAVKG